MIDWLAVAFQLSVKFGPRNHYSAVHEFHAIRLKREYGTRQVKLRSHTT